MEPLSALGVAAAVVQFAHFGYNVIKGSYDVYESSSHQIATVSHDLSRLLENAEAKLKEEWPCQPVPPSPTYDGGSPVDIFRRLCRECREINSALDKLFAQLVPRGESRLALAASSLAVELKKISRAGEIDRLAERLNQVRQQTMSAILVLLLGEAKKTGVDTQQFAQQQVNIMSKLDRIDEATRNFSEDVVNFVGVRSSSKRPDVSKVVHYVLSDRWNAKDYLDQTQTVQDIGIMDSVYVQKVLQSLFFDSMGHREGQIPQQYAETFEWIFEEPRQASDGHPLWHNFPAWLEGDSSEIYWITGKPGAGKSTLIKFVAHDERFQGSLNRWAGGARLLLGRYFSWTAGAHKLQKSHEGLLRTLLHEILQQEKSLLSRIFPGRWFLLQIFDGEVELPEPQLDELLVAFRALLSETAVTLRLALTIDGLDEFEGDHRTLVGLLHEANSKPWVKICASSRPWNVFKDEYSHNPMLQLENLTREDIDRYVREKFQRSPGFQEFEVTNPLMASAIVNDIVEKAEGVFLWVSVVLGLLEGSFQEGHNLADLRATIYGLPSEVSRLFTYIWDRIQLRFRGEASRYFEIMAACDKVTMDPYALTFWFGDEEDAAADGVANMTQKYISSAVASLGRRLVSRTGGLLEIFGSPLRPEEDQVGYMHRTASDWVRNNWASISSTTEKDFDPTLWLLRAEILRLARRIHSGGMFSWYITERLFKVAAYVKDTPSNRATLGHLLDRLDELISKASRLKLMYDSAPLNADDVRNRNKCHHASTHWCSTRLDDRREFIRRYFPNSRCLDGHLNLLGFVARLPVVPYIKFKLEEDPAAFSTDPSYVGILENLTFGPFLGAGQSGPLLSVCRLDMQLRLELAELILQHGLCAHNVKKTRDMVVRVRDTLKPTFGDVKRGNESTFEYFNQFATLLDRYGRRKKLVRRLKNLISKRMGECRKRAKTETRSRYRLT
ncbi:hypothetical protein DL767_002153 [Monosporascus sp. MG133]|nr:hypothetical protein DL767_002153 [Monosporascus sp. MG133]